MPRRKHSDWAEESRRMRVVMSIDYWADFDRLAPFPGSELGHRVRYTLYEYLAARRGQQQHLDDIARHQPLTAELARA